MIGDFVACKCDIILCHRVLLHARCYWTMEAFNCFPARRDERGNVNNIIVIGEAANVRPYVQHQQKVCFKPIVFFILINLLRVS